MNSALIEKIKKLLSLAQSDNANERDAALAKAHALATENQIDLALLDLSTVGVIQEEKCVKEEGDVIGRRWTPKNRFILSLLRDHFNVHIIRDWDHNARAWRLVFVGKAIDVEFAKWLYGYLCEEFDRRWTYFRKTELASVGASALAYRNTFILGLYRGLDAKLHEERAETVARKMETVNPDIRAKFALVVQDETERRKQAMNEFFPSLTYSRSRPVAIRSHSVLGAGKASGRTISTARAIAA